MKKIIYLLIIALLSQCNMGTGRQEAGELIEFDCSVKYPEKEVYIQDIADVEYIPLETNSNTLLSSRTRIIHVSDNYIVAVTSSTGDVFVFDGKGRSKFSFNHTGKSGTEYTRLSSAAFDENNREIFIFDRYASIPKIQVYAEDGEYKRALECPPDFVPQIYNFDDAALLAYDEYGLSIQENYSNKPYLLLSKKDGGIVDTLDINLPVRISTSHFFEIEIDGQTYTTSVGVPMPLNISYGKDFIISDLSSDTIYKLTPQKKLTPVIVRTPPVQNTDPKIVVTNSLITDRFIILRKAILDFESIKTTREVSLADIMYDFETKQFNVIKLINKDFESLGIEFQQAITHENIGVDLIDISTLFEEDEKGKVHGKLKQIISTLDEEDNPVLVKMKF